MGNSKLDSKKSTKLVIRQRRVFSDEFKRDRVAEIVSGKASILSISKLWNVTTDAIYVWIYKYSPDHKRGTTIVVQKDSEANKLQELLKKVSELERALGQKQMLIDYQDKLIEIASKELEVDLNRDGGP